MVGTIKAGPATLATSRPPAQEAKTPMQHPILRALDGLRPDAVTKTGEAAS